ncbi:MAG: hypothetical protein HQ481_19985 [Alphaproteobacteria bacterium]|nr:hypothetical protein [Alphaproteobacteria bacterium]
MWSAIKASFSSKEMRAAPRVHAVGSVRVDSQTYPLENWSTNGVLINGHDGRLAKGQKFKLSVEVTTEQGLIEFNAEAIVTRVAGDKLAAQFFMIEKHKKKAIMEYFTRATRGR